MKNYSSWYESNYHRMTEYGLWLKGNEINTLPKTEFGKRPFKVLFTRLSTYNDVSASFTHLLLYQIAASIPGVFPDLSYLPPENDAKIFRGDNIPWLLGTGTKNGPDEFNLIGFSNSIIQELINIPAFLRNSGIPIRGSERADREDIPMIILGGANALYSSALWGSDSLVDGVFVGGNTRNARILIEVCRDGYKNEKKKKEILEDMERVPGFYLTDRIGQKSKTRQKTDKNIEILEHGIMPYGAESMGESYLQISEGCRAMCGFCAESWGRKPYKELDVDLLIEKALKMKAEMGLEGINIFSFNFNMYSEIYKLLWDLAPVFKNIGLKSQRFDTLAEEPDMVDYQLAVGKNTFSCGLEGISERIRKYLNKKLDTESLYKSLDIIFKAKARELKVFLISTGLETEEDFSEFEDLLRRIREIKDYNCAATRVIFSVTPLVRFPWTPLEYGDASSESTHERIIKWMKQYIGIARFESRSAMEEKEYLVSQILARSADNGVGKALVSAAEKTSFIYYKKIGIEFFNSFMDQLSINGLSEEQLLSGYTYEEGEGKTWARIDTGIKRKFLWDMCEKNSDFLEDIDEPNEIINRRAEYSGKEFRDLVNNTKNDECALDFAVSVGEPGIGLRRKYVGLVFARAIMKADKSLAPHFKSYVKSHWDTNNQEPVWITGEDILTLSWTNKAAQILKEKIRQTQFINEVNKILGEWGKLNGLRDAAIEKEFRIRVKSQTEFNADGYFKAKGLKYALRKKTEGGYYLEFTKDALRKKIVSKCVFYKEGENIFVEVMSCHKFNPEEFVRSAFNFRNKNDWVRVKMVAIEA